MKITHAFYDVPAGQVEISQQEFSIAVKLNGKTLINVQRGSDFINAKDRTAFATFVSRMNEIDACTRQQAESFYAEMCRFA